MQKQVTVLGAGAFGSAFSSLLLENGFKVNLWCREPEVAKEINEEKINKTFLPGIKLTDGIWATDSFKDAISESSWIFIAVPVRFLRTVLKQVIPYSNKNQNWVILSKGIEKDSLMLPSQILDDVLGYNAKKAVCMGPNFAKELAEHLYSAATIASENKDLVLELRNMLNNFYFKTYISYDLLGVQASSALKNVLALAAGILKGAGFKNNTRAFLLTQGLAELGTMVEFFGGKKETIYGLSGLGDLILTATNNLSRNFHVGELVGSGKTIDEIEKETNIIAEGINTIISVSEIINKTNLKLPICQGTYDIIYNNLDASDLLNKL